MAATGGNHCVGPRQRTWFPTRFSIRSSTRMLVLNSFKRSSQLTFRAELRSITVRPTMAQCPSWMSEEAEWRSPSLPPRSATDPQLQNYLSLEGKRVVVCEDEGITQMQLRRILTQAGLIVVGVARNGRNAVETVLREGPDLVLMYIQMPEMDGLKAVRQIMTSRRVCVVMLTAYVTVEYQSRARALGASGYMVKPITAQTPVPQIRKPSADFRTNRLRSGRQERP